MCCGVPLWGGLLCGAPQVYDTLCMAFKCGFDAIRWDNSTGPMVLYRQLDALNPFPMHKASAGEIARQRLIALPYIMFKHMQTHVCIMCIYTCLCLYVFITHKLVLTQKACETSRDGVA